MRDFEVSYSLRKNYTKIYILLSTLKEVYVINSDNKMDTSNNQKNYEYDRE